VIRGIGLLVAVIAAAACNLIPAVVDVPRDCAAEFSAARCVAIADQVAAEVERDRGDVTSVTIVPDPPPEGAVLGGAWPIRIRLTFDDGTTHEGRICGGLAIAPACSDDPHLDARSVMGGYHDVPCAGEPPDGCPSPIPSPKPEVVATAKAITIATRSIPIDHDGPFEVELGRGSLANGILTDASFAFQDPWPSDVAVRDGVVLLEVRSLEPDGRPFDNIYLHGTREGVERVAAILRFDVLWFEPGAELGIRDVVVR
jgi:hypothetical protein